MMRVSLSLSLLFSLVHSSPCPPGYTQDPRGGDCYQMKEFYDYFATRYQPKTYDEAEANCNADGGGLLTSIHSLQENDFIIKHLKCGQTIRNIGLKCKGSNCKWDDGSPLTFANFRDESPSDDGKTRCYGIDGQYPFGTWKEHDCGKQERDCWVCRVKAQTIDCSAGEMAYKGGCVSIHASPLDQKSAEAACLADGGHLASIHSYNENDFYNQLAVNAGVNGTSYIGGQFSNGLFEWTDGTNPNINQWANAFPNTIFGTCVQMLLASEFGTQGQWTNIDCAVKQPFICFRDGTLYDPTTAPVSPKADAKCPPIQYYTGSGSIFSPNYPLSIPSQQTCEYVLGTKEGTRASVQFSTYNCQSGTSLELYDGLNSNQPFATFTSTAPVLHRPYTTQSNVMKLIFAVNGTSAPLGTGWEAAFSGL